MSSENNCVSVNEEIQQVEAGRPHLVILGAGASRAAFPNGESSGKKIPLMEDFVELVPIKSLLEKKGINYQGLNFEEIYSNLSMDSSMKPICNELQAIIYDYFSTLSLPEKPTIYDYLILSLRDKDVIATFNWDPFLIQACWRNLDTVKSLPKILFLHGNVLSGYCKRDKVHGTKNGRCETCGQQYTPSQLLYPVKKKNYYSDPEIASQWEFLKNVLKHALVVTIFGYGAPASDAAAIDILSQAWGNPKDREFEQIEIIDIKDDEILRNNWKRFIHTHHYETHTDFYESWIANHPRRTIEAFINEKYGAKFIESNPIPKDLPFTDLWSWFSPLLEAEERAKTKKKSATRR